MSIASIPSTKSPTTNAPAATAKHLADFRLTERSGTAVTLADVRGKIVVVSFVRVAGVLLTFTYLIVPAVCSVMLFDSWPRRLAAGSAIAALSSLAGIYASYRLDLPTGAAIVCASGLALVLVNVWVGVRTRQWF